MKIRPSNLLKALPPVAIYPVLHRCCLAELTNQKGAALFPALSVAPISPRFAFSSRTAYRQVHGKSAE